MTRAPTTDSVAKGAAIIEKAFLSYIHEFQRFTLQARLRFEARDWLNASRDSANRLDVYGMLVSRTVRRLLELKDLEVRDRGVWRAMKSAYLNRVDVRTDSELAETFFNSITRRVFTTVGVDEDIEFVAAGARLPDLPAATADVTEQYRCDPSLDAAVIELLRRHEFSVGYENLRRDAASVSQAIVAYCRGADVELLQVVRWLFFRNKAAYLVGRVRSPKGNPPFVVALLNDSGRVIVDAVLLGENDVSVLFSFTRSYFFVDAMRPAPLVAFLRSLMPRKPVSDLYTSIGHNKHGKTVFYRSLLSHLQSTDEIFEPAPGARGMVMIVFTMPSLNSVFKVIRDRFGQPKTVTRREVMEKYRFVFRHDRAGRLADAQEFEHIRFDKHRFSDALLAELAAEAADTVEITRDSVVVHHVYTERKMAPLNLYLRYASPEAAEAAVVDFGRALRELAATNIFPGDLLPKNFGVTQHGRVVFYDYDEICPLSECNFRRIPPPRNEEDEMASEPWYYVGPRDVFPEEFLPFLGLAPPLRDAFSRIHGDLLTPEFWQAMQEQDRTGIPADLIPYSPSRRLRR